MRPLTSFRAVSALALALLLCLSLTGAAVAQNDGQFCVRSFDDRNGNQTRDQGEPLLNSGIGADLIDESGIVIASALLANSPTAAQGVICFQFLPPGQYTIVVTSAEYRATTPDTMTVTLVGGELPAVLEFGAQSVSTLVELQTTEPEVEHTPEWPRIITASVGAVIALLVMQILGFIIYAIRFRRRAAPQPAALKTDTGQFKRPVNERDV